MQKPDFITVESFQDYHMRKDKYLSSHMLGDFRKCPELYRRKHAGSIEDEDRPAYVIGRAAHCMILEGGDAFNREYSVGEPINHRTGKPYGKNTQAYHEWLECQEKEVISPSDFDFIKRLQMSVWLHDKAAELLDDGIAEGVIRADYCGFPCQIRMDFFNHDYGIIDLKTCDDLTWFEADARRYGYIYQLAFYQAVLRIVSGKKYPVHIIAVEKKEPFRCGIWRLADTALNFAEMENAAAIERLKKCRETDIWPTGYEAIRTLDSI
jgi:hypothetical protein